MLPQFGQEKKILITGSKGNLGSALMNVLGNNYRLVLLSHDEFDITNKEQVKEKMEFFKPSIIINTASYNKVDKCEESEEEFKKAKKINGTAVGFLADAAIKYNSILIHYSTDYVFGKKTDNEIEKAKKQGGFPENETPAPGCRYAETKLMGEQEIYKRKKDLKYYLVRTSKIFGPKGESKSTKASFFDIMIKLANKQEKIDVIDSEESCFTYTRDLAEKTKEIIEGSFESGIYHITNSLSATWYGAAKYLFKIAKIKVEINPVPPNKFSRPAHRPKYSVLKNTKLEPLKSYKEALEEYLSL